MFKDSYVVDLSETTMYTLDDGDTHLKFNAPINDAVSEISVSNLDPLQPNRTPNPYTVNNGTEVEFDLTEEIPPNSLIVSKPYAIFYLEKAAQFEGVLKKFLLIYKMNEEQSLDLSAINQICSQNIFESVKYGDLIRKLK